MNCQIGSLDFVLTIKRVKMSNIRDAAAFVELEFIKRGYKDRELKNWCIREAYENEYISSIYEFVLYALSLYDAQLWGDKIDGIVREDKPLEVKNKVRPYSLFKR